MSARRFVLLVPLTLLVGLILYAKIDVLRPLVSIKAMAKGGEQGKRSRFQGLQSDSHYTDKVEQDNDDIETFMKNREKVYAQRRSHLMKVCEAYGKTLRIDNYKELPHGRFRWLAPKKLMVCFNAKVGTSTWSRHMVSVLVPDVDKFKSYHGVGNRMLKLPVERTSKEAERILGTYTKALSVRHPFARIVSAFKGKIRSWRFGGTVHKMEKFLHLERDAFKDDVPFEAFVRLIVNKTTPEDGIREKRKRIMNIHWFPYYANCAVCDLDYSVIIKTETIYEDLKYMIIRFGFNASYTHLVTVSNTSTERETLSFFKALPRNLTLALYERYRLDFELFDYSVEKYLAEE